MQGPRAPSDIEFPQVVDFLDQKLRNQVSWSITKEYPTALTKTNLHNMRIISNGSEILSHAVLKPLIVKTPHMILKVGAIGSVVTDEKHRGQGLSSQIINSCVEEASRQSCDIAILWSGIPEFYQKLGFKMAGFEESYVIDKPLSTTATQLKFKTGSQIAPEALLRIYQQHTVTTHRTVDEMKKFLQIPNSQVYSAWGPQGTLEAFAVEGKGADLTDYIHEWAGNVSALLGLFNFIQAEKKKGFVLITPKHANNLRLQLLSQNIAHNSGFLGMIRILNPNLMVQKLNRAQHALGGAAIDFNGWTQEDLVEALFGPWNESVSARLPIAAVKSGLLPLRFWLWGWDSV